MNSSVINSSRPFNHSSGGSSPQLLDTLTQNVFHPAMFVFLVIERSITLVVGYPANLMVMWLVAREKSDSSTSDIFVFNLAIADALLCVMSTISCLGMHIVIHERYFVSVMRFATGIKNSSPLFLTCICLDRYVAVVHPIVFTSIKDNKIRGAICTLIWGLMIAFALCRTFWLLLSDEIYIGLILSAFVIMVFCNISIMRTLRMSVLGKEKIHPMKKKAFRIVQIYLAIIVFHYLPVVAIKPFQHIPDSPEFLTIEYILFTFMYLSTVTQPFLYIFLIKQLPWLKKLLSLCCRSPSPE